jgi:hypothetical protein
LRLNLRVLSNGVPRGAKPDPNEISTPFAFGAAGRFVARVRYEDRSNCPGQPVEATVTWLSAAGDVVATGARTPLEPVNLGYYPSNYFVCAGSGETTSSMCGINDPCQTTPVYGPGLACTSGGTCP